MCTNKRKVIPVVVFITGFLCLSGVVSRAQETKRPFTVTEEIGLTLFGDPNGGKPEVYFSPDGNYFAVWTERGRLDLDRSEDSLRFYRSQEVENFLAHSSESQPPSPVWVVNRSDKKGSIIKNRLGGAEETTRQNAS